MSYPTSFCVLLHATHKKGRKTRYHYSHSVFSINNRIVRQIVFTKRLEQINRYQHQGKNCRELAALGDQAFLNYISHAEGKMLHILPFVC
jgi:hypothetical protein